MDEFALVLSLILDFRELLIKLISGVSGVGITRPWHRTWGWKGGSEREKKSITCLGLGEAVC